MIIAKLKADAEMRPGEKITLRGSFVGTRQDMAEALTYAAEGRVKSDIKPQPLSAINQVLERLERGQVASRVVLDFLND